jgi:hypothetical protein
VPRRATNEAHTTTYPVDLFVLSLDPPSIPGSRKSHTVIHTLALIINYEATSAARVTHKSKSQVVVFSGITVTGPALAPID